MSQDRVLESLGVGNGALDEAVGGMDVGEARVGDGRGSCGGWLGRAVLELHELDDALDVAVGVVATVVAAQDQLFGARVAAPLPQLLAPVLEPAVPVLRHALQVLVHERRVHRPPLLLLRSAPRRGSPPRLGGARVNASSSGGSGSSPRRLGGLGLVGLGGQRARVGLGGLGGGGRS